MARQDTENLFRRYKGEGVTLKTTSGSIYEGRVVEITNDYVVLSQAEGGEACLVSLFFSAIESVHLKKATS